jgi:hypothetical protein
VECKADDLLHPAHDVPVADPAHGAELLFSPSTELRINLGQPYLCQIPHGRTGLAGPRTLVAVESLCIEYVSIPS